MDHWKSDGGGGGTGNFLPAQFFPLYLTIFLTVIGIFYLTFTPYKIFFKSQFALYKFPHP